MQDLFSPVQKWVRSETDLGKKKIDRKHDWFAIADLSQLNKEVISESCHISPCAFSSPAWKHAHSREGSYALTQTQSRFVEKQERLF